MWNLGFWVLDFEIMLMIRIYVFLEFEIYLSGLYGVIRGCFLLNGFFFD